MGTDVLLRVEGITKSFSGTRVLSSVNLSVIRGEIHALVGENGAGKSTLMNIIGGVFRPDEGNMFFNDCRVSFRNPKDAQDFGIGFVHQELSLFRHLSVAENIFVGRLPLRANLVDRKKLYAGSKAILDVLKTDISPSSKIKDLNIAQQQMIEIAKTLFGNSKLIILDEPTSSLTEKECSVLFDAILRLRERGISILYISHKMSEIFALCQRISVLRDGVYIDTVETKSSSQDRIVSMMVGRTIDSYFPSKSAKIGDEIMRVESLSRPGSTRSISFSLYKGEVLGFAGLVGAGRTEAMRALCGIDPRTGGEIFLGKHFVRLRTYEEAIREGIAYLSEDRKLEGLFSNLSIKHNISSAILRKITNLHVISGRREKILCEKFVRTLGIRIINLKQTAGSLSGGNQQKAMIAKWLATEPRILILDEPTKGIDVYAKAEIHKLIRDLAEKGIGVILISSELPEIMGMCDRIIVMHDGEIKGTLQDGEGNGVSEKAIMTLASGVAMGQNE